MKIIFVSVLFIFTSFSYAGQPLLQDTVETKEGENIIGEIGLSSLKVAGQVVGGFFTGMIGGAFINIHPVTAGIGWILGSSVGVYLIGNLSGGKGNFWWTVASGAAPVLFFIIPLDNTNDNFSSGAMILGAAIVALTTEIIGYYITKPFSKQNVNLSVNNFLDLHTAMNKLTNYYRSKNPVDIYVDILRINF